MNVRHPLLRLLTRPPRSAKTHHVRHTVPLLLACAAVLMTAAQNPPAAPPVQAPTRPPDGNDQTLRPLSPEEVPPNLNFYALDPLYRPGVPLGWSATRIEEKLDRGVVALPTGAGRAYIGWRLLASDPRGVAFNVYRSTAGGGRVKVNARPLTRTTDLEDATAPLDRENTWFVRAVANGVEQDEEAAATLPAGAPALPYRAITLREDVRSVDRVAVADLNADGTYDFVVKHPAGVIDPGRIRPSPATYKIDAYDGRTGTPLWRIDLGWNVNHGIWFSPLIARDLDGDHVAEVCLRTAPYAATREQAFDGGKGIVLEGPEHLACYDGKTGQEIDTVEWIERGKVTDWADTTGNRSSRHMLGVAYLDGKTPSVLVVRGTYGLMKVDAWTLRKRRLEKLWRWTNERAPFKYQGQGQHSIKTGDIDEDGCDEILNGSIAIDNDGRTMWSTGLGHGDRFYLADIAPDRPGLEIWYTIEDPHPQNGVSLWDARRGIPIFGTQEPTRDNQVAGGLAADIDPSRPGMEVWGDRFFFSAAGVPIPGDAPPQGDLAWWDADLLREIVSRGGIGKWQGATLGRIEGSVQQVADIAGDWREEIVTFVRGELRIYSTTVPAADRRVTLMQDALYRNDVTHRSMGYPHVPMTSYFLGERPRTTRR